MRWITLIAIAIALVYGFQSGGRDLLDELGRMGQDGLRKLERGVAASRGLSI